MKPNLEIKDSGIDIWVFIKNFDCYFDCNKEFL